MDSDRESNTSNASIDEPNDFCNESGSEPELNKENGVRHAYRNADSSTDEEDSNEDDEDQDEQTFEQNWSQKFVQDKKFCSKEVKGHTTLAFVKDIKPIDVFNKFFTEDTIDLMVKQTNIYGQRKALSQNRTNTWQPVNKSTIRSFLGLLIIMGLHRLPRLRDHWSRDKIFHTAVVADVMPRDEFYRIFTAFHLSDNREQDQFDKSSIQYKLFKVFDFMSLLKRNFQKNFTFGTNVCIDESMIKFKGRSSLKQYMPSKPIKRGYKVWCLADSSTGYLYNFDIYCGKEDDREGTLAENVVLCLISKINLVEHRLFF